MDRIFQSFKNQLKRTRPFTANYKCVRHAKRPHRKAMSHDEICFSTLAFSGSSAIPLGFALSRHQEVGFVGSKSKAFMSYRPVGPFQGGGILVAGANTHRMTRRI